MCLLCSFFFVVVVLPPSCNRSNIRNGSNIFRDCSSCVSHCQDVKQQLKSVGEILIYKEHHALFFFKGRDIDR